MTSPARPLTAARTRTTTPLPTPLLATLLGLLLALGLLAPSPASASAAASAAAGENPVTPGNFTGEGFDQCVAPEQWKMDRWLETSPFLAVGIYISGTSRGCRDQPNLSPTWVSTQLRQGWELLPITLGPQASCHPSFPRYSDDRTIDPRPGNDGQYPRARRMGRAEARTTDADARALGLTPGSTLWYDLEGFDLSNTHCRESALAFLSGWSYRIGKLGWVSGVYSSAGSGIKALDDARVNRPDAFTLPEAIWIARWDGAANTSTSYIRDDGWRPGGRVKQYQGGHDETWGGVRINIDRNFLDLGRGSFAPRQQYCGGVRLNFTSYDTLRPASSGTTAPVGKTKAAQCLLRQRGLYDGAIDGAYDDETVAAVRAWRDRRGFAARDTLDSRQWMSLLAAGARPVLKQGSAGGAVRRLQRALTAAAGDTTLRARGVFTEGTDAALRRWQGRVGLDQSGVLTTTGWRKLVHGRR